MKKGLLISMKKIITFVKHNLPFWLLIIGFTALHSVVYRLLFSHLIQQGIYLKQNWFTFFWFVGGAIMMLPLALVVRKRNSNHKNKS